MKKNTGNKVGGVGYGGILLMIFVVLKLTNLIDWSWWWVLSPLWAGIILAIMLLVLIGLLEISLK